MLSVAQSARVADLLLAFAEDLAREGRPNEKYFLAGQRFVEFFLDEKGRLALPGELLKPGYWEPLERNQASTPGAAGPRSAPGPRGAPGVHGLGPMAIFFPLARMVAKTGKDRYRKALDVMVKRFSAAPWDAFHPPAGREGRDSDSAASFLSARLFVEMRRLGYRPLESKGGSPRETAGRSAQGALLFSSLLIPWIRLQGVREATGGKAVLNPPYELTGSIGDSFFRRRVLFAGYETAHLLLGLGALTSDAWLQSLLRSLALLCLRCSRQFPLGTSFFWQSPLNAKRRPKEAIGLPGPVDSRRLAREIESALRLAEEHPRVMAS
jgi:hypothetical protein